MEAWPHLNGELWHSVRHGQRGAHGDSSRSGSNYRALRVISLGFTSPLFPELLAIRLTMTDTWAHGLLVISDAGCVLGYGTKHYAQCFPKHRESR
jgi:hypothetical protein